MRRWRGNAGASADAPALHFHRWGRNGQLHLQRRFLRERGAAGKHCQSAPSSGATRHLPPTG